MAKKSALPTSTHRCNTAPVKPPQASLARTDTRTPSPQGGERAQDGCTPSGRQGTAGGLALPARRSCRDVTGSLWLRSPVRNGVSRIVSQEGAHLPVMTDPSDPGPLPKCWYSVKLKLPELSSPMDGEISWMFPISCRNSSDNGLPRSSVSSGKRGQIGLSVSTILARSRCQVTALHRSLEGERRRR